MMLLSGAFASPPPMTPLLPLIVESRMWNSPLDVL